VPADVRLQLWLALGFLLVCLVNTVGLLLASSRPSSEMAYAARWRLAFRDLGGAWSRPAPSAWPAASWGWYSLLAVGRAPATGELCLAGPPRRIDAAVTFAPGPAGQPARRLLPAWRAMQVTCHPAQSQ
jgi:putative ABC transport system permease protein